MIDVPFSSIIDSVRDMEEALQEIRDNFVRSDDQSIPLTEGGDPWPFDEHTPSSAYGEGYNDALKEVSRALRRILP